MTTAPSPSTLLELRDRRESFLDTLSSTIGSPFELWSEQSVTEFSTSSIAASIPQLECVNVIDSVELARKRGQSKVRLKNGRWGVWIRIFESARRQWLAFGVVPDGDSELIDRLIHAAARLVQQEVTMLDHSADMTSCLETLTYGMEEQNWLRSLSDHLTLCSAERTLYEVATELLPSLKRLIKAESVAILLTNISSDTPMGQPSFLDNMRSINCVEVNTSIQWDGPAILDDKLLMDWLYDEFESACLFPLVQNRERVDSRLSHHDVQSVCAIQIRRAGTFFGWIVALNRIDFDRELLTDDSTGISELEFGTVEAGLISAAATMLSTQGHNFDLLKDRESLVIGVIRAMGFAVDARDPYTQGHSERVGRYGRQLAEAFGLSKNECDRIYLSGLLHDVGKIGVPDAVLGKPDRLTEEEFTIIKRHPEIGARIVQTMPQLADLLPGVLFHHESIDGTGYPKGLKGDEIPLMGRILAIADAYDAMTSDRPYRKGMPRAKAISIMTERAGVQWDKTLMDVFVTIPEQALILDAIEGDQGWNTDDRWLLDGAKSILLETASVAMK